jgi:quercetin dioxygenase-like cupin family protein
MTMPSSDQRIFTARDYYEENVERPIRMTYRDDDLMTLVEWAPPGELSEPPHSHPTSAHVFVFLEGEGEALVEPGKWEKVQAGQFIIEPRNKVHAIRSTTDKPLLWVCVAVYDGPYVIEPHQE